MKVLLPVVMASTLSVQAAPTDPADVQRFIERRETCDHFRGEIPEPDDITRMKEVLRQIDAACRGSDRQLARLKRKYRGNVAIQKRLSEFDPHIEAEASKR